MRRGGRTARAVFSELALAPHGKGFYQVEDEMKAVVEAAR
jgi:hypothetical protein